MPRLYNPKIVSEWGYDWGESVQTHSAVMEESKHGEWVKLSTYTDVYNQLVAANNRLQREVHALRSQLAAASAEDRHK